MTKEQSNSGTVGKMMSFIKPLWGILIAMNVFSLASSLFSVAVPTFTKSIVDKTQRGITGGFDMDSIMGDIFVTVALIGAAFVCSLIQSFIAPKLSQKMGHMLREKMNDKTNRIPLNFFDTMPEGETLSTMTNDIDMLSTTLSSTIPMLVSAATMLVGCVVLMFGTNWILAITTIVASFMGMFLSMRILAKSAPYFKKNQNLIAKIDTLINEDIKGLLVIKSFNAEREVTEAFTSTNKELFDSLWKSQLVMALMGPIAMFSNNLSYILVCVVGAVLVLTGNTEIGTIIAFIQFAQLFATPISQLTQSAGTIQPAIAAGDRVFNVLEQQEFEDEGKKAIRPASVKGTVDFDHVKFGYSPEHIIVHDFSCHVRPGQKVAIVGPTGAGKSTLINLLMRFYEVNGGDIRIDGTSIYDMPRESLHAMISMVLQETWTFEGSIRDNVVYNKEGVSDAKLMQVLKQCGLDAFVSQCPEGLDTVLSEDAGISAGQKQLITIARAMIDGGSILILDEATSSVDTRTEAVISAAIDKLMEGRTSFVIAHRLSTIRNADKILVLKDGDVIESGTHDELMAQQGFYADLYMSQFDSK